MLNSAIDFQKSGMFRHHDNNPQFKSSVHLLELLRQHKCDLALFDKIVDWAKISRTKYQCDFDSSFKMNRAKTIAAIEEKYDMHGLRPKVEPVYLNAEEAWVDVVYFDFVEALKSLLQDKELMNPDNWLDDYDESDVLDDFNSGTVWKETIKLQDPKTQKTLFIVFFMDKTHTDINGRLKLEPVFFRLSNFKREICNKNPKAWRCLGFATDLLNKMDAEPKEKLQDYHKTVDIILRIFKEAQKKSLLWCFDKNLQDGQPKQLFELKVYALVVIGDTEGHDKACGKMVSRNNMSHHCRYCDIHVDDLNDLFAEYECTN